MVNGSTKRPTPIVSAAERRGPGYNTDAAIRAAEAERDRLNAGAAVGAIDDPPAHGAGAGSGQAEPVANGLLGDTDRILSAEADAIAEQFREPAAADPQQLQQQQLTQETVEQAYNILGAAVVSQGAAVFIPNWRITPAETKDMSDAIVQALMLWFPDGLIPPKYMAILAIAGVGARIAMARRDELTGELPPRYAPKKRPPASSPPQSAAAPPPDGVSHIFQH